MSKVLCEKSDLVAIADSIRSKTGSTDGMKVAEIPQKIEAIETGSNINIQASKSITYTSNGTATITPDAGYDALSSVDVTVNVASGGGSGAGFKVTFPATAKSWTLVDKSGAHILLLDGTYKNVEDYSTIGGKTIENVVAIHIKGNNAAFILRMTLSSGRIAQFQPTTEITSYVVTTAPNTTPTPYKSGRRLIWWPLADTVISSIEMHQT